MFDAHLLTVYQSVEEHAERILSDRHPCFSGRRRDIENNHGARLRDFVLSII